MTNKKITVYEKPELAVIFLEAKDLVTLSFGQGIAGFADDVYWND